MENTKVMQNDRVMVSFKDDLIAYIMMDKSRNYLYLKQYVGERGSSYYYLSQYKVLETDVVFTALNERTDFNKINLQKLINYYVRMYYIKLVDSY